MILDPEHQVIALGPGRNVARRALRRVLERIVEQVRHDAPEELAIGMEHREVGGDVHLDPVALHRQALDHLGDEVLEEHPADRDGKLPTLDARRGEQVLHQPQEPIALPLHPFQEFLAHHGVVRELGLPQGLGVADQGRDRGAQLVRHHRHELTLHPVQLSELVDTMVLLLQQLFELAGLIRKDAVLLGQPVGQQPAPEVHLSSEDERRKEHRYRPQALGDVEPSDDGAEQPEPQIGQEELVGRRAVHLRQDAPHRDAARDRGVQRHADGVHRVGHHAGQQDRWDHPGPRRLEARHVMEDGAAGEE